MGSARLCAPLGAAALLLIELGAAAAADGPRTAAVPLPPIQPAPAEPAMPPYQERLDRLAELMGTLAFLRNLCGDGDGAAWHDRMEALLDAEGPAEARRARLAGSYNRGYVSYQLIYHTCTPAAETVISRSMGEGARIAARVSAQFGTP